MSDTIKTILADDVSLRADTRRFTDETVSATALSAMTVVPSDDRRSTAQVRSALPGMTFSSLYGELPLFDLGVVTCSAASPYESRTTRQPRVIDANDPASVLADAAPGMSAVSTEGVRLGEVVEVEIDPSAKRASIVVEHRRLARRFKRIDGELVDLVHGGRVILSISQHTFRALPDL